MGSYSEYKDINLPSLGKVPTHWNVIPNGYFLREKTVKNTNGEQNLSVYRDYGVIPRDSRDDNHNRVSDDISSYKLVEVGDFVLNKMKCWMGSLGVSDHRGIVSPSYTVCEPTRKIHRRFFHYLLRSQPYIQIYESLSYGVRVGQWELRYHDFKTIKSVCPPLKEQTLISKYLDRKTSQIDSLIEKIERKIELLKEQRTSLINQCVTKGLNPDVEMKDSGIEWIGEIPSHWRIKKVKYIGTRKSGDGFPIELQNDEAGTIPFFKVSDTNNNGNEIYLNNSNNYVTETTVKEMKFKVFKADSIAFPKIGEVLRNNKRRILGEFGCIDNNMMGLEIHTKDSSKFLYYVLSRVDFSLYCSDGTVPSISETQVGNINIPIPPEKEQINIVDYLDVKLEAITFLVDKELNRVKLLKEYRQSLISNTVTGKIRVTEDMI